MSHIKLSKFYITVVAISAGCGFQHGYHTAITNIPSTVLQNWIRQIKTERLLGYEPSKREIDFIWSMSMVVFPVGGIVGASMTGYLADRWGRKKSLILNNGIIVLGLLCMTSAKKITSFEAFILGRLLAGIYAGISGGICQMFLTEIAPDRIRGAVASSYQVAICTSIFIAQLVGLAFGTENSWFHMFTLPFIPALFQGMVFLFCPESPKYLLMTRDRERRAKKALSWYRGTDDVAEEMEEMKREDELVKQLHLVKKRIEIPNNTKRVMYLCLVLNLGQQLCGINSIVYFSTEYAREKDLNFAPYATTCFGLTLACSATVAFFIVDRVGRRQLLMISFLGMALISLILILTLLVENSPDSPFFMKYFVFIFIICYLATFSMGAGPIPWFITSELFNYSKKSTAVALTGLVNWIANLLVMAVFPPIKMTMGYYAFFIFVILDCFFFCYVVMHMRETCKLSARELIELYNN